MSHDTEAAYASSEIAEIIMQNQNSFFGNMGTQGAWSVFAGREGGHQWPLADGVICAQNPASTNDINIAFEYKRLNEGVHGILTALGQSFAYLEKGYQASIMAIPEQYTSHSTPGQHINRVLQSTAPDIPIFIYTYKAPNLSATRPFHGRINCVRSVSLPSCRKINRTATSSTTSGSVSTLWAHMREGMSHPDAFFRYCQSVKIVSSIGENLSDVAIPTPLAQAIDRISPGADVYKYLSNTAGDSIADKAWRHDWFHFYFWNDMIPFYKAKNPYVVNDKSTKIFITNTQMQGLFSGRVDSIKEKLVAKLNASPQAITEDTAWEEYAQKVRKDAHSYREVIDSGLFHIGFLSPDGTLTDLGYRYVDACERIGTSLEGIPMEILKAAVLQNGQYGAMLHYIYKLSEDLFDDDIFAFSTQNASGKYLFDKDAYLQWLDNTFDTQLHLVKKSTVRAGGTRKAFQAEIAFLKKLGFVREINGMAAYRVGLGLEIDWPQVQSSMAYFQNLV